VCGQATRRTARIKKGFSRRVEAENRGALW